MLIPTTGLADYITGLARQHGVHYAKTSNDALAEVVTRLADDNVEMDQVVLLLLALERAGVIPSEDVVPLHINYLREKLNVRPGDATHPGTGMFGKPKKTVYIEEMNSAIAAAAARAGR